MRTQSLRGEIDCLFITTVKPYHTATPNTLYRWVKNVLRLSGIDTDHFGPGSIRGAATSKATEKGVPIDQLLLSVDWSQYSTFATYYKRPIVVPSNIAQFVLPKEI